MLSRKMEPNRPTGNTALPAAVGGLSPASAAMGVLFFGVFLALMALASAVR